MPATIAMYADIVCPYAYLIAWRWRQVREREGVRIAHKSLALEYINREPTPKRLIEVELPLLLVAEPDLPWRLWDRPESEWPVTVWPAFEAVKCAERQSLALADELDWGLRHAFFAESRCISMRHEILMIAEAAGLDMERFTSDFDSGVAKGQVLEEARDGWERLRLAGSPTLVFPNGRQVSSLGLPEVHVEDGRVTRFVLAPCQGTACQALLVQVIEEHLAT